jgi:hypothetical protein
MDETSKKTLLNMINSADPKRKNVSDSSKFNLSKNKFK